MFDGGEGVIKGGRAERSRESGVWVPFDMDVDVDVGLEGDEVGGEVAWGSMIGEMWGEIIICERVVRCACPYLSLLHLL